MATFLIALIAFLGGALFGTYRRKQTLLDDSQRAAQEWQAELLNAAPESVLYCDRDDRVVAWNESYASLLGPLGNILKPGLPFGAIIDAVASKGWIASGDANAGDWVARRIAARATCTAPWETELADGRTIQFMESKTASGGVLLVGVDITDAKRREASSHLMYELNPIPMWTWDPDALVFTGSNHAAQELFGWSAAEFEGLAVLDTIPEEERVAVGEILARGLPERYDADRPWRHLRKDGSERLCVTHSRRLPGSAPRQLLTAVIDVTRQIETETVLRAQQSALEEASARAEAANLAKSEFLANMSHEIRTPLNGVIAVADVLSRSDMSGAQTEMVALIRASGETLNRLLSDILDLARIESGRLEIEQRPYHLGETLRSVAGVWDLRAREKGIGFKFEIDAKIDHAVLGDEVRTKQIVSNLLSNAVKFTSEGEVRFIAKAGVDPETVELRVEDTGVGFDEDVRGRLFQRFHQADGSITRRFGGSGLGLSICRELSIAMGGEIWCESRLGEGSVFQASLTVPPAELAAEESPAQECALNRGLRVLVADDHPTNQRVVKLVLSQVDADITLVDNGDQALNAFIGGGYDLILMDMQMPVRDGLSATKAIRALESKHGMARTPLIMLTANASAEHLAASLAAGADRHLAKPFTAATLLDTAFDVMDTRDEASVSRVA